MAYNPGVSNQSGQILAAGLQNIQQQFLEGQKIQQHNDILRNQAMGEFSALAKQDPDVLAFISDPSAPPDVAKAAKKMQTGKQLTVAEAALLSTAGKTLVTQKQEKQKAAFEAQRTALMEQQAQAQRQANAEAAARAARLDQARTTLMNLSSGVGKGVYRSDVQENPLAKDLGDIARFTGDVPTADHVLAAQAKLAAMTKPGKAEPVEKTLPSGERVAFSPDTGAFSVLPQAPERIAASEMARESSKKKADYETGFLTGITNSAESGRASIAHIDRIRGLYEQGAKSGFGQPLFDAAGGALARAGLYDGKKIATQQELDQALSSAAMEYRKDVMSGTGAVSDYETKMIQRATANMGNTPEANLRILGVLRNAKERAIKLDTLKQQMEDEGKSQSEIVRALERARSQMPIGIEMLAELPQATALPAAPAAGPGAKPQPKTSGGYQSILSKYGIN